MIRSRRGFTLAELIMAIALLAFFSVLIVEVFAAAGRLTTRADRLDRAVACAADLADQWKSSDREDIPEAVVRLQQDRQDGRSETLFLDADMTPCSQDLAVYAAVLTIRPGQADGLWLMRISIRLHPAPDCGPVYEMDAARYFAPQAETEDPT